MKRHILGVAATALFLVLPATGTAYAQLAADDHEGRVAGFVMATTPPVEEYWTPERMANARPEELEPEDDRTVSGGADLADPGGTPAADAKPTAYPPTAGQPGSLGTTENGMALQAAVGVPKPYTNPPDRLNGKVFYTKVKSDGTTAGDWACSGTSVNSPGLSMVWTAGHCIHGGPGYKAHKNWTFVPAYSSGFNGDKPYGTWKAKELWTWSAWIDNKNWSYDFGAAIVWKNNGTRLTQKIGGQGIWFNIAQQQDYSSFGYPGQAPFTGWLQYRCNSALVGTHNPAGPGPNTNGINCDMTKGSSGGGWLVNISANGWGYVNSVNSYKLGGSPNIMYGPYHGSAALELFNYIKNKSG